MTKPKLWYAIAKGRTTGIVTDWTDCKAAVYGVKKAKYKSFQSREEAEEYLEKNIVSDEIIKRDNALENDPKFQAQRKAEKYRSMSKEQKLQLCAIIAGRDALRRSRYGTSSTNESATASVATTKTEVRSRIVDLRDDIKFSSPDYIKSEAVVRPLPPESYLLFQYMSGYSSPAEALLALRDEPNDSMYDVHVFTDGSLIQKHKVEDQHSGYAYVIPQWRMGAATCVCDPESPIELYRSIPMDWTNNRNELNAIRASLYYILSHPPPVTKAGKKPAILIVSDSEYCVNMLTSIAYSKLATESDMKNPDIITDIIRLRHELTAGKDASLSFIEFKHVRSHTKDKTPYNYFNAMVDYLAKMTLIGGEYFSF